MRTKKIGDQSPLRVPALCQKNSNLAPVDCFVEIKGPLYDCQDGQT